MAECLLLKSGGQTKKLPVLNPSYPANVTNWQGEQATFKVEIFTPGVPAEYTYQWYRDGAKWTGATKATVSWSSAAVGSHSIYCVVTNKAGEVTSRVATLTVKNPNMTYTYSGTSEKIDDGSGNWRIKFKSSGTLKFTNLGKWDGKLDVFCVGGGCAGAFSSIMGLAATGMSITAIPGMLLYLNGQLPQYLIACAIGFVVAFVLTTVFYKPKEN